MSLADRLWAKVDRSGGPKSCWPFTGALDTSGYGLIRDDDGRLQKAHRVALQLSGTEIPDGLRGLHDCDNPPCCNPGHLYVGTPKNNAEDRERRGRSNRRLGEQHGRAKITAADVLAIRALPSNKSGNVAALARSLGIAPATAYAIRSTSKTWKHVP